MAGRLREGGEGGATAVSDTTQDLCVYVCVCVCLSVCVCVCAGYITSHV